jgi:hypothetical protein
MRHTLMVSSLGETLRRCIRSRFFRWPLEIQIPRSVLQRPRVVVSGIRKAAALDVVELVTGSTLKRPDSRRLCAVTHTPAEALWFGRKCPWHPVDCWGGGHDRLPHRLTIFGAACGDPTGTVKERYFCGIGITARRISVMEGGSITDFPGASISTTENAECRDSILSHHPRERAATRHDHRPARRSVLLSNPSGLALVCGATRVHSWKSWFKIPRACLHEMIDGRDSELRVRRFSEEGRGLSFCEGRGLSFYGDPSFSSLFGTGSRIVRRRSVLLWHNFWREPRTREEVCPLVAIHRFRRWSKQVRESFAEGLSLCGTIFGASRAHAKRSVLLWRSIVLIVGRNRFANRSQKVCPFVAQFWRDPRTREEVCPLVAIHRFHRWSEQVRESFAEGLSLCGAIFGAIRAHARRSVLLWRSIVFVVGRNRFANRSQKVCPFVAQISTRAAPTRRGLSFSWNPVGGIRRLSCGFLGTPKWCVSLSTLGPEEEPGAAADSGGALVGQAAAPCGSEGIPCGRLGIFRRVLVRGQAKAPTFACAACLVERGFAAQGIRVLHQAPMV